MGGECVVDGDGNAAEGQGPTLDQLADVNLERKMAPLMLCHMDPIHPLQTQENMGRGPEHEEEPLPSQVPPHTEMPCQLLPASPA